MPDTSALFPQPPQQNQQGNSLLSNPGQAIGLMQGIQNLQIQQAQRPAIERQPYLQNEQTNTGILGERQRQQAEYSDNATRTFSGFLSGIDKPSDEHINRAAALTANRLGQQNKLFPDVIPTLRRVLIESKDRAGAIAQLRNSIQPPGEVGAPATIGYDPNTGQPIQGTRAQQEQRAAGAGGGGYQTTPPLGTDINTTAMLADQQRTANYPQEINGMHKALQLVRSVDTGPGTEGRQKLQSAFAALFPGIASDALKNKISEYDQARKYMINNAQNAAQTFGPHTNAGLNTAVTGRPNPDISTLANDQLLQMNIAYRRLEQAHIDQAARQGGRINYIGKKSELAPQLDANAFRIDMMTPEERKTMAKKMSPAEKERFNRSVDLGISSGVIQPPGQ